MEILNGKGDIYITTPENINLTSKSLNIRLTYLAISLFFFET